MIIGRAVTGLGLEHAASRAQRPTAANGRTLLECLDQRRPADAGRPLDDRNGPGACHGLPKQCGQCPASSTSRSRSNPGSATASTIRS